MVNYANTQLYEIIEHDQDGNAHVYRGHTTQPLHKRLAAHRMNYKRWTEGKYGYCSSYEVLKHGPARIELVRVVSCLNIKEANREEGKFIRELPTCVNLRKNFSPDEYYQANIEFINAKQKKYYKANKETINAKAAEKITCECGAVVNRSSIPRHKQSKKHLIRTGELPNEIKCYIKIKS